MAWMRGSGNGEQAGDASLLGVGTADDVAYRTTVRGLCRAAPGGIASPPSCPHFFPTLVCFLRSIWNPRLSCRPPFCSISPTHRHHDSLALDFVCATYTCERQHAASLTHYDTSVWDPKVMVMFTMGEFDLEVSLRHKRGRPVAFPSMEVEVDRRVRIRRPFKVEMLWTLLDFASPVEGSLFSVGIFSVPWAMKR